MVISARFHWLDHIGRMKTERALSDIAKRSPDCEKRRGRSERRVGESLGKMKNGINIQIYEIMGSNYKAPELNSQLIVTCKAHNVYISVILNLVYFAQQEREYIHVMYVVTNAIWNAVDAQKTRKRVPFEITDAPNRSGGTPAIINLIMLIYFRYEVAIIDTQRRISVRRNVALYKRERGPVSHGYIFDGGCRAAPFWIHFPITSFDVVYDEISDCTQ
ncbi:hypothetical protein Trydic_g12360 [Trypoxylus dichotomus]